MTSGPWPIFPRPYCRANPGDWAWWMETDCPLLARAGCLGRVTVAFLQLVEVAVARMGGERSAAWREAVERTVELGDIRLGTRLRRTVDLPPGRSLEPLPRGPDDESATAIVRQWEGIAGHVEVAAEPVSAGLATIRVRLENHTWLADPGRMDPERAAMRAMLSAETVLHMSI